ncbi:MAG: helix-turn-helix domain-containing protein [Olsenella sp.]|nr:helix-turn-helix domain-containing protein [Olsenella sp.]
MELNALLERLPQDSVAEKSLSDPGATIDTIAFFTEVDDGPQPNVLYFTDDVTLPSELPDTRMYNVVLFGCDKIPSMLVESPSCNAVLLRGEVNPFSCYNQVQRFFLEDVRVTDIVRRMLTAHFSNRGLQYVVEEASRALGNPIVVVDTAFHYVARYSSAEPDATHQADRVLSQEFLYESVLEEGINFIKREKVTERCAQQSGPVVIYNDVLGANTMVTPSVVHGVTIAHTMMVERNHPFGDVDVECMARLGRFVAQEMQKTSLYVASRGQMDSYFLVNLLNDEQPSHAVTARRLSVLGFRPLPNFYVAVIRPNHADLAPHDFDSIAAQLTGCLQSSIYATYEHALVILFSREDDARLDDYTDGMLRKVAMVNDLTVGVSNAFNDLTHIRSHYEQACAAIDCGKIVSPYLDDGWLYHYCDYAYVQMLALTNRQLNLMNFVHPSVMRLARYDREHGTELMDTLFIYLQNAGNTHRAAKMLNLHKNTLLYRMGRVREILGMDLTSGEDRFLLQLSLRVLFHLDLFQSRICTRRLDFTESKREEQPAKGKG